MMAVSLTIRRLAITLRPMTDEELNRQFSAYSNQADSILTLLATLSIFARIPPNDGLF